MTVPAVVSLGSNLGDRMASLRLGLDVLATGAVVTAVSPVYETAPVGGPPQPAYLNAVALLTVHDAWALLDLAGRAEASAGRVRDVRWGPRTLDVDLIVVDAVRSDDPRLTLPHPRAHERAFVLVPWHDVDAAAELPGHGPVAVLVDRVDRSGVERRPDLQLEVPR